MKEDDVKQNASIKYGRYKPTPLKLNKTLHNVAKSIRQSKTFHIQKSQNYMRYKACLIQRTTKQMKKATKDELKLS